MSKFRFLKSLKKETNSSATTEFEFSETRTNWYTLILQTNHIFSMQLYEGCKGGSASEFYY